MGVVKGNVVVSLLQKEAGINTVIYADRQNALFALLSGEVNAIVYPLHVMRYITTTRLTQQGMLCQGELLH